MLLFMDQFVERVNAFPGAVYEGIQISLLQTVLLYPGYHFRFLLVIL